ncbi:hypothetical protein OQA88_1235 [Cercophora sp. LCS_1]
MEPPSPPNQWKPAPKQPPAQRISSNDWEAYRRIITYKYICEDKSVQQVRSEMQEDHHFIATARQYVHRLGTIWKLRKYKRSKRSVSPGVIPQLDKVSSDGLQMSNNDTLTDSDSATAPKIQPLGPNLPLFNIRNHHRCAAQGFQNISLLKHHIRNQHLKGQDVKSAAASSHRPIHRLAAKATHSEDPEDGIDAQVADLLSGRKLGWRVSTWDDLWQALFPDDLSIPSSGKPDVPYLYRQILEHPLTVYYQAFSPTVEDCELYAFIEEKSPALADHLKEQLRSLGWERV